MRSIFFNNMSMRSKMLFIYLVAILVPLFLASIFYAWYANAMIERQSLETMRSRTLIYSQNLSSRMQEYVTLANMIANNSDFIKKLDHSYIDVLDALSFYQDIWAQYAINMQTWPHLRNITIYSGNQTMHNSIPYFLRLDNYMGACPEYEEILARGIGGAWYGARNTSGKEYWHPANANLPLKRYRTFTYNRAIYSPANIAIPIGVLTVEIDTNALGELIQTEGDLDVFVLDYSGTLIAASGEWHAEYAPALAMNDNAPVYLRYDNRSYYGDAYALDNGWRVVTVMSMEGVLMYANAVRNYGLLLLLGISCVIVTLIFFFSTQISKRSGRLLHKMEAFMGGDMVLGEPLGGGDELGLLDEKFSSLARELKQRIDETYVLQLQKNRFHLQTLQMQINPHFLYNTLSTIAWLSDSGSRAEIRAAVESLASFYRVTLSKGRDIIPLSEELKGLNDYLQLQKLRYAGRINVYCQIDDVVTGAHLPKLTLQPLVENSIRHGLNGERESISIMISAHAADGIVEISIQDDGVGMPADMLKKLLFGEVRAEGDGGFGLSNISERIKLYFGESCGFDVRSEADRGTLVIIKVPFMTSSETDNQ